MTTAPAAVSQSAQDAVEGLLVTMPAATAVADPGVADQGPDDAAAGRALSGPCVLAAYAAVQVIAEAIRTVGDAERPERVAEAIHAGRFKTPIGDLSFNGDGDVEGFSFGVYEWHLGRPKTKV
ncbi:hypothetical protein [Streptomyces sp. ISL-94]|uniref:hypothetical protein n=1 Tax=Streptomyces sp. ISL-94 TaxID=2819190 RepID=UPI001BEBD65B|nr:hypothetical protein [Streptomyces sp. ISL-94]MBT2482388.1 hypothetical protein [Streptomyces sp. ISL-94]